MIVGINSENETADLESLPTSADSCILASVAWNAVCFESREFNLEAIPLVCSLEMGSVQGCLFDQLSAVGR